MLRITVAWGALLSAVALSTAQTPSPGGSPDTDWLVKPLAQPATAQPAPDGKEIVLSNGPTPATWQATYSDCPPENGDINGDGLYPDFGDINPFGARSAT